MLFEEICCNVDAQPVSSFTEAAEQKEAATLDVGVEEKKKSTDLVRQQNNCTEWVFWKENARQV